MKSFGLPLYIISANLKLSRVLNVSLEWVFF